jgi:hypothetical protein
MTQADERPVKGGKRGAPRGTGDADQIRAMLAPHREDVIARLVELAKLGDPACLRLYMERIAPAPRAEDEKVSIPGLASAVTLREKAECILGAASRGEISAFAADKLMALLDKYRLAVVATDHEARLAALEQGRLPAKAIEGETIDMDDLI